MIGGAAASTWTTAIAWFLLRSSETDALVLESAELVRGFTSLLLRLDEPVNVSAFSGCENVLSGTSLQKMGMSPQCQWLLGGMTFQVLLGHQPVLELGDSVELLPSVGAALQAAVNSSESPEAVAALRLLPPQVQRCGPVDVAVDAALSSGGAGRFLQSLWRVGSGPPQAGQVIQDFLTSKNDSLAFMLPAATISSAVDAALAANASLTVVRVELILAATNWLGHTNESSAMLEVDLSDVQLPALEPSSSRSIRTNQSVSFTVATRYAETVTCATAAIDSANISLGWEYRSGSGGQWLPLENVSLQNSLVTPWKLRFAAFQFAPGSSHQLRATAAFNAMQVQQHVFQLNVADAAPVVPVITGPSLLPKTCDLVLDASQSFDPDGAIEPQYFWSCAANDTAFNCHAVSNFRTVTWTNTDGTGASGAALRISAGELAEDIYTFNVTVVRAADRASFQIASWMVQVENAPVVPITLSVPWYANELLSAQLMGRLPDGTATVLVGDACGMTPDTEWVWALVSEASPSKILTYLDTTTVNLTTPGELAVQAGPLPENYLVPGEVYAVALLERGSSPGDLAQAEALGLRFARSVPFVADGAPSGGYVTCVPSLGTALTTEFQIATSGWYDEDFEVLMYSFYRFPLPSGMSLVADGDGFSTSGIFLRPSVDWRNKSSPNYWSKLGGVFLQQTSGIASLRVPLPPGEHLLAVVAEDELGAVSSAWLVGPLVQAPSGATSPASSAIASALRLGDAETILNTLAASVFAASESRKQEADALLAALATLEMSDLALSRVNAVVVELLRSAAPGAAAALSDFLTALMDTIAAPTLGLEYLLEAVLAVKVAFEEEAWLRADQLRELLAKCANAVVAGSSGEQRVKSLDHLADETGLELVAKQIRVHDALLDGVSVAGFSVGPLSQEDLQAGCRTVVGQVTAWRKSNPYAWPNVSTAGVGSYVSNTTDVYVIEMRHCGGVLNISGKLGLQLSLPNLPAEAPPEGYAYQPACILFNTVQQRWTTDGLRRNVGGSPVGSLICSANLPPTEFLIASVVYRPELVPVEEEPPSIALIIVAIIVFLACMAGLAYANMKKSDSKADAVSPKPSSKVAPAPTSSEEPVASADAEGEAAAAPTDGAAEAAPEERAVLSTPADAPALPPLPSGSSQLSHAADGQGPGSPAEALVPKPRLETAVPVEAVVTSPEFESFAEGFKKSDLPLAPEEPPAPPPCRCPEEP